MSDHVYKRIEVVGSSSQGYDDAINKAVAKAKQSIKNLEWFEVVEHRGHIENGGIAHHQVVLRLGFRLD